MIDENNGQITEYHRNKIGNASNILKVLVTFRNDDMRSFSKIYWNSKAILMSVL